MLDMHFLSDKIMSKYNLEKQEPYFSVFDGAEYFIMIENTDFWVLGIDEENDIIYAEYDGDGISFSAVEDLEDNNYVIIGVQKEFIPGMISTREPTAPVKDARDFIRNKRVYKLKYQGGE